jgi:hypothetical protein
VLNVGRRCDVGRNDHGLDTVRTHRLRGRFAVGQVLGKTDHGEVIASLGSA